MLLSYRIPSDLSTYNRKKGPLFLTPGRHCLSGRWKGYFFGEWEVNITVLKTLWIM